MNYDKTLITLEDSSVLLPAMPMMYKEECLTGYHLSKLPDPWLSSQVRPAIPAKREGRLLRFTLNRSMSLFDMRTALFGKFVEKKLAPVGSIVMDGTPTVHLAQINDILRRTHEGEPTGVPIVDDESKSNTHLNWMSHNSHFFFTYDTDRITAITWRRKKDEKGVWKWEDDQDAYSDGDGAGVYDYPVDNRLFAFVPIFA